MNRNRRNCSWNGIDRWYCGKNFHIKAECFKRNQNKSKPDAKKNNKADKVLASVTKSNMQPAEMTLTASHAVFFKSRASLHMMKDVLEITGNAVPKFKRRVGSRSSLRLGESLSLSFLVSRSQLRYSVCFLYPVPNAI